MNVINKYTDDDIKSIITDPNVLEKYEQFKENYKINMDSSK